MLLEQGNLNQVYNNSTKYKIHWKLGKEKSTGQKFCQFGTHLHYVFIHVAKNVNLQLLSFMAV